jgi:hypothetical protein
MCFTTIKQGQLQPKTRTKVQEIIIKKKTARTCGEKTRENTYSGGVHLAVSHSLLVGPDIHLLQYRRTSTVAQVTT